MTPEELAAKEAADKAAKEAKEAKEAADKAAADKAAKEAADKLAADKAAKEAARDAENATLKEQLEVMTISSLTGVVDPEVLNTIRARAKAKAPDNDLRKWLTEAVATDPVVKMLTVQAGKQGGPPPPPRVTTDNSGAGGSKLTLENIGRVPLEDLRKRSNEAMQAVLDAPPEDLKKFFRGAIATK